MQCSIYGKWRTRKYRLLCVCIMKESDKEKKVGLPEEKICLNLIMFLFEA